ncbi:MAG: hypothetical protein LIO65_03530, partial [Odoribacter sp.]|nr:hypothetical protein [Odoribacter sp.]
MKTNKYVWIYLIIALIGISCEDNWNDHYDGSELELNSDFISAYEGSVEEYLKSVSDYSQMSAYFEEYTIYSTIRDKDQLFTFLVYSNSTLANTTIDDEEFFTRNSVCDLSLAPTKLSNGLSILMWNNKYLSVSLTEDEVYIAKSKVLKVIKTDNAYIYVMENPIHSPRSLYEYLLILGDDYSLFKELVLKYEEQAFDKENSVPKGVDNTGNTVYDSTYVTKNTLMDRYNSAGELTWSMHSEYYNSTLLIPNNTLVENALREAYENTISSLSRIPNSQDTIKYEQWIIKSAFYSKVLSPENFAEDAPDLTSVSGYVEGAASSTAGITWKNSVQKVDVNSRVEFSNGVGYYMTSLKIPNNVVIWRIKSLFRYYDNCNNEEVGAYFQWENTTNVMTQNRQNSGFNPTGGVWPEIQYFCLRASPTAEAIEDSLTVALDYLGFSIDDNGLPVTAMIPPGEYYLRMGFESNGYTYRYNIYVNDSLVATDFNPNIHYER